MKYERREYDHGDSAIYAFEKEDMYGCHNDIACLLYDRIVKHCIIPRKPNQLVVNSEYPLSYGFPHTKVKAYINKKNYVLELTLSDNKQLDFIDKICDALKLKYETKDDIINIIMPLDICTMDVERYLSKNDIPLEYANRMGFKQYPDGDVMEVEEDVDEEDENEWDRFDLCSTIFKI